MHEPTAASSTPSRPLRGHLLWLILHLFLLGGLTWLAARSISHDSANLLDFARAMVHGAVPYVDFVELNPPMSIYVHVPAVLISSWLGVSLMTGFAIYVGLLIELSLLELLLLLRRFRPGLSPGQLGGIGLIWIGASFWLYLHGDFGQREHLFVLMYAPFMMCRWLRYQHVRVPAILAVVLGVQAALGASIKPGFVLTAIMVEVVFFMMRRSWRELARVEAVAFVLTGLAYALHWLVMPASMRIEFFHHLLPLIVHGYAAYDNTFGFILNDLLFDPLDRIEFFASIFVMLIAGALAFRREVELRMLFAGLSMAAAISLAAFFLQHKGWSYHLDPFRFFAVLILGALIVQVILRGGRTDRAPRWRNRLLLAVACLAAVGLYPLTADIRSARMRPNPLQKVIESRTRPGDPVLILSTNTADVYPLILSSDRRRATRFGIIFPLALVYYSPDRPRSDAPSDLYRVGDAVPLEERRLLDELSHDIRQTPPRLIAICRGHSQGLPGGFRLLDYLKYNGFIAREIEPHFEDAGPLDNFEIYLPRSVNALPARGAPSTGTSSP